MNFSLRIDVSPADKRAMQQSPAKCFIVERKVKLKGKVVRGTTTGAL